MTDNTVALVVVATPNPDQPEAVQEYQQASGPLLMAAGATSFKRMGVQKVVDGNPAAMVMTMEFPSVEAVDSVFESEEYKALVPVRDKGFKSISIYAARDL